MGVARKVHGAPYEYSYEYEWPAYESIHIGVLIIVLTLFNLNVIAPHSWLYCR